MATVNPIYAKALEKQLAPPKATGDYEKDVPSFSFKDIGDGIRGTVTRVGEPFDKESIYEGVTTMKFTQVITLKDVQVKRAPEDEHAEPKIETYPKMNVWMQKNGQFASVAIALEAVDRSDIEVGDDFIQKWTGLGKASGKGSRPHKFESKVTPA